MASAPIPLTNIGNGYTIVTQVIPSSTAQTTAEQSSSRALGTLRKFLKGEPKALGAVQIMNGFLMLLFGIMLVPFFMFGGFPLWGPVFHIIAGSLTVSASNKLHLCAVKVAMAANILSAITAAIQIIVVFMQLMFSRYIIGRSGLIAGVLLVSSLLQFAVSIAISAFACKATCSREPSLYFIDVVPNPEGYVPVDTSFPTHHSLPGISTAGDAATNSRPVGPPPAYSDIKSETDN